LGLIFLLIALSFLKSNSKFKWLFISLSATLAAISREYVAFLLFTTLLGFAIMEKRGRVNLLLVLFPALTVFIVTLYQQRLWNYISSDQTLSAFPSRMIDAFLIFAICYLPILPFVMKGLYKDKLLIPAVSWLLIGSFSATISPIWAVPGYQRWLMLLVFPFSIYAVRGFKRMNLFSGRKKRRFMFILLFFIIVGVGYSTGAFSYVVENSWVPPNLVQSSISPNKIDDVINCLRWLNDNATKNSALLADERFIGWAWIYLERAGDDIEVINYVPNTNLQPALDKALSYNPSNVYLILQADLSPKFFKEVHSETHFSILQYLPEAG
jgi:hypothetical protein